MTVSVNRVEESDWLLANVEGRGYYRVNYDINNWQLLTQQLLDDHQVGKSQQTCPFLAFLNISLLEILQMKCVSKVI